MGNTTGREKSRHSSGEDSGPTMRSPRDEEDMFMGDMDESGEFPPGTFRVSGFSRYTRDDEIVHVSPLSGHPSI